MLKSYGWVGRGGAGWVAHKTLVSAPVPWIGDLGLGDQGPGLDNNYFHHYSQILTTKRIFVKP